MKPDRASAKGRLLLAAIEFARERGDAAPADELQAAALEYERQMTPNTVAYVRKRWGKR
jgi:hypothetical protein